MARHRLGLVRQVLVGRPRELRPGCLSSLGRQPVERLSVELDGVPGDACADTRHHGGPEKALHAYPFEHYSAWHALWPGAGPWRTWAIGANRLAPRPRGPPPRSTRGGRRPTDPL